MRHVHKQIKLLLNCLPVTSIVIVTLLALTIGYGCQRRMLEQEPEPVSTVALVPIKMDWSKSGLINKDGKFSSDLVSVWVFPENGDKPLITILQTGSRFETTLRLPVGVYSILIFNEEINSSLLSDVEFRGTDKWSTFEVYAGTSSDYKSKNETKTEILVKKKPPVAIASWGLEHFEVTQDMVLLTHARSASDNTKSFPNSAIVDKELDKLLNITPLPLTKQLQFNAKVANLAYAGSLVVTISGAIEGIYMATRTYNTTFVAHPFVIPKSTWKLNTEGLSDGEVQGNIFIFGLNPKNTNVIMDFVMVDGQALPNSPVFNISDQVASSTGDKIVIDVGYKDRPTVDPDDPTAPPHDKPIELPFVSEEEVFVDEWGNVDIFIK